MKANWAAGDIPRLDGKTAVVTGANCGIGYHTALELARAGADVIVACRDVGRAEAALASMREQAPGAQLTSWPLDLANLASVRTFAARRLDANKPLDILVNNAGVMAISQRETTADGFEMQFGTNYLGHFALTGLLLPALLASRAARVVTLSSTAATWAKFDLSNLQSEQHYAPMATYSQTKLANLLGMLELQRRAGRAGITSVAAHPGLTATNMQRHAIKDHAIIQTFLRSISQSAERGALPSLYAATAPDLTGGEYFGPKYWFSSFGPPVPVRLPERSRDAELARALWEAAEKLTGMRYEIPSEPARAATKNAGLQAG